LVGLRDVARVFPEVRFYAISVDPPKTSLELAKKIAADGKGPVRFSFLSDPQSSTIDRYGLRDPAYSGQKFDGIPHPSVFVLDAQGRIRWEKVEDDYRVRPSNDDIAAALNALD